MITEESGKQMPAMTVFSATIRYLTEHLLDAIGNRDYDIRKDEVKWVLTVPAIWNDAAKQFTREAAEQVRREASFCHVFYSSKIMQIYSTWKVRNLDELGYSFFLYHLSSKLVYFVLRKVRNLDELGHSCF